MRKIIPYILPLLLFTACGTLDPSGTYKGDKFLYDADMMLSTTYTAVESFLRWELTNRNIVSASVTAAADKLRDEYPKWHVSYFVLRDQYLANPTPENKAALATILSIMREATAIALRNITSTSTK